MHNLLGGSPSLFGAQASMSKAGRSQGKEAQSEARMVAYQSVGSRVQKVAEKK